MLKKISPLAVAIAGVITASAHAKIETTPKFEQGSILVKYKTDSSKKDREYARQSIRALMDDNNADGIDDKFARFMDGRLAKLQLGKGMDVKTAIKLISKNAAVEYAEPNYILKAIGMPDDPSFSDMWGLNNTGQNGGTADADIDAVEAWDTTTGSEDIVIAVIDTGVDYTHPDLADNMWTNPNEIPGNGIDDDGNGVVDDVHGFNAYADNGDPMDSGSHGTHVAGTIGAQGNNGVGVTGVSWDVTIVGCQFLGPGGTGSTADAIECIDYITDLKVNHGVDIKASNNSWGGGGYSQALNDSIVAGGDAGILFIAAAGNSGVDNDASPHYPSNYESDYVMSIASTDRNDDLSIFTSGASSYGLTTVDMAAPGSAILSTVPGNSYAAYSGTSMATPHVTGAAALVWSLNPDLTPVEMKQLLMNSGDTLGSLDGKMVSGKRLNVASALTDADPEPGYRLTVQPASQTVSAGESASYAFDVGSVAGWSGDVDVSVSVNPSLEGVSLSASTVSAGGSFTLDVMTSEDTGYGDYSMEVTAVNGDMVKSKTVSLEVLPAGLRDFDYSNTDGMDIPDNDAEGITSSIEIADDLQVFGVTAHVDITHTWRGDLRVALTSPNGTEVVLHDGEGSSADDLVMSYSLADFNTEMAMGTWTLSVSDNANLDTGRLNNWGLTISGTGEAAPAAPVADFSYDVEMLDVSFTNMSSDVNEDIASYSWDFGDGNTSSDMNPMHSYAEAGSYTVMLTATDAEGREGSTSMVVDVFAHSIDADISRSRITRRGTAYIDLTWSGAMGDNVAIYRNGEMVSTTRNDGRQRDRIRDAAGTYEYKVCEVESTLCSDPFTVSF
ncbi:peptidase S8 [Shewanella sp. OPT22]|nr:peptidase S8 [Shewanella sp. OPT22]